MDLSEPLSTGVATASLAPEIDPSTSDNQSAARWHSAYTRCAGTDEIHQLVRTSIPEPENALVWYQADPSAGHRLPSLGLRRGFPVAFPVVDVTVLAGSTYYFLDPALEWSDESLDRDQTFGMRARRILFRATSPDETVVFADDFLRGAQVTVSLSDPASTVTDPGSFDNIASNPPKCSDEINKQLETIEQLPVGWNSYDAAQIDPEVVEFVKGFAAKYLGSGVMRPQVVPTNRGGVQLEWHTPSKDLEIRFDSPGVGVFFYEDTDRATELENEIPAGLDQLVEILREFTT